MCFDLDSRPPIPEIVGGALDNDRDDATKQRTATGSVPFAREPRPRVAPGS